jgi:hypothetical protein
MIEGKFVVEPPSAIGIIALLMSTKSQVLRASFCTQGRVDAEPPSVADNLYDCVMANPRALQTAVDADVVDDIEDQVVKIYFSGLSEQLGE